ncbi:MAG: GNAT family N-acetyltransferase [Bdellovibrionaceae bacterium]|nr:GNAT family N-acetyltransferase [Pseudobdellovibrionaceae bacterium]
MLNALSFDTQKRSTNSFSLQDAQYALESASSAKDFLLLFKLRRAIETSKTNPCYILNALSTTDKYDLTARHVMVRNKKNNMLIGGFRLIQTSGATLFSSESTFDISVLKEDSGKILEMSRMFLLPEHKHKGLLQFVATFVHEYCGLTQSKTIISCQSLNTSASQLAALSARYFARQGLINNKFTCPVSKSCHVPNFQHWYKHFNEQLSKNEIQECSTLLSTGFQESLLMGATVSAIPALDRRTNRIDFLTILDKNDLNKSLWKKSFSPCESSAKLSFS